MQTPISKSALIMQNELQTELYNILNYWIKNTLDTNYGGFVGRINHKNEIIPEAPKGIILNSRILWSFSAASNHLKSQNYSEICERAFHYLNTYFKDTTYDGVFWELDFKGQVVNPKKQVYAQAFTIYALSEYYIFSKNEAAKSWAISLFHLIEKYTRDKEHLGYIEAFNRDWSPISDMRLSQKDMNAEKTMNTHLHVLEAYTSLLKIYNSLELKQALTALVNLFLETFLNSNNHFHLFFDKKWKLLSHTVSYGHDIETAWLLIEAARQLKDKQLIEQAESLAISISDTFLNEALDHEGAVINEKDLKTNHLDTDRHWWPQVESIIGLHYANTLKPNDKYVLAATKIWNFTKAYLIDHTHGEWHFRVDNQGKVYTQEDKVSMWKAPYHSTRACIILNTN